MYLAAVTAAVRTAVWMQQSHTFFGLDTIRLLLNILQAAGVFALVCQIALPPSPAYRICRRYSSWIYFSHMLFFEIVKLSAFQTGLSFLHISTVQYFLVVLLSVLSGTIIFALEKRRHFQWLHYIY